MVGVTLGAGVGVPVRYGSSEKITIAVRISAIVLAMASAAGVLPAQSWCAEAAGTLSPEVVSSLSGPCP
jgi:hypothetical protein